MTEQSQEQQMDDVGGDAQQVQAGRDAFALQHSPGAQVNIQTSFLTLFGGRADGLGIDWDWAEKLLRTSIQPEIKGRLKDTLWGGVLSDVDLSEEPELVARLRSQSSALDPEKMLYTDKIQQEWIDPRQPIIQTYTREDITGSLLILGTPGAGKTTTLLTLAEQLVAEAINHPKTVIPIIFELSTWQDNNQSIHDWLIEQLYENHGGSRKHRRYEVWLEQKILLPLLDGLDELGLVRQQKCTEQINEFARHYPQMVVCCRVKEFRLAGVTLSNLRGAVQLQPLSDGQIQNFLTQVGKRALWEQIQTVSEMRQLLDPTVHNPEYPEAEGEPGLLRMPLFIDLAARVYEQNKPLMGKTDLFERYIDNQLSLEVRTFERRESMRKRDWAFKSLEKEPDWREVRSSLTWLAQKLSEQERIDFLIEKIQPSWLTKSVAKYRYHLISGWIIGLMISFPIGLTNAIVLGAIYTLLCFLSYVHRNVGHRSKISMLSRFVNRIQRRTKFEDLYFIVAGLLFSLAYNIAVGLIIGIFGGLIYGWIYREINYINPVEKLKFLIPKEVRKRIISDFYMGLMNQARMSINHGLIGSLIVLVISIIGIINKTFSYPIKTFNYPILWIIFMIIVFGVGFWLVSLIMFGLPIELFKALLLSIRSLKQDLVDRLEPNQGIWNSVRNAFIAVILIFLLCTFLVVASVLKHDILPVKNLVFIVIFFSLPCLSIGFLYTGGLAFIQHFCLRIVLSYHEKIPLRLTRFLKYCTERRLLQCIGGRYRFIHREILDYLAHQPHGN
jgi:DNA polymerase III delta prime subunit